MKKTVYQEKQARLAQLFQSLLHELGDISLAEFLDYVRSQQVAEQEAFYFAALAQQSEDAMAVIEAERASEGWA